MSSTHHLQRPWRGHARPPSGPSARAGGRPAWRRAGLALALPLVALLSLLLMPTIALASGGGTVAISPSSGPVGTHTTVTGAHLTPGTPVQVGYSSGDCSSGVTIIAGATGTTDSNGSVTISVTWPPTGTGSYVVCVTETQTGKTHQSDGQYQVLSTTPADITITPNPMQSSQQVTVKGTNFLPGNDSVEVFFGDASGDVCANSGGTATIAADGTWTITFKAPFKAQDTPVKVMAVEPQHTCDGAAVQQVSKTVTVKAAPAATATAGGSGGIALPVWPPSGVWSVVYCLVGLLLFLLLLLALLVVARQRRKDQPVTIQERNTVMVNSGAGRAGGAPAVQREVYAQDQRGRQVRIADEVTTVEEEPMPPPRGW